MAPYHTHRGHAGKQASTPPFLHALVAMSDPLVPSNDEPRYRTTMTCLCVAALFNFQFWGITSIAIAPMQEQEGFTTSEIGLMLPLLSMATVPTQLIVGSLGPRISQRWLLAGGCAAIAGGATLIWSVPHLGAIFGGYMLCGIGYGIMNTVPYLQLGLLVPRSKYALWYGLHEAAAGMLSPALGRGVTLGCTVALPGSRWGWRLPWVVVSCGSVLSALLMLLVASPKPPRVPEPLAAADGGRLSSREQCLRDEGAVWCHPVTMLLLPAIGLSAFAFNTLSIWIVFIGTRRYPEQPSASISLTLGAVTSVAYPAAVLATALLIRMVRGRFEVGARWSGFFLVGATGAIVGVALSTASFSLFVITFALYAALAYHPWAYYKSIPVLLLLTPRQTSVLLSRFGLVWTVCGNIFGVFTSGLLIDVLGIDAMLWVLVGFVLSATALWCVPAAWAWTEGGPVPELKALRAKREKEVAAAAWHKLRLALATTRELEAAVEGSANATASAGGAGASEDDGISADALRWRKWRIVPLMLALNNDRFFAASTREPILSALLEDEAAWALERGKAAEQAVVGHELALNQRI